MFQDINSNPYLPNSIMELERMMGNIENNNSLFSYSECVKHDENEQFPSLACTALEKWGLHYYYVPLEYGGKLDSFVTLYWLLRIISRRDLTIAIGHGKTYLGASPIYVGGSLEQKIQISKEILSGKIVSLGLTEKNHGSDLIANSLYAKKIPKNYVLSGEKWLINNATRGDIITLFVKTADQVAKSRNYSLLYVDKKDICANNFTYLSKIKTHGIRGADISGIKFSNAEVKLSALIGKEGAGLEITLKSLQISRTLCSSLSLGVADTALRTAIHFVTHRKLYHSSLADIPYVKQILVNSYLNILICEAVSLSVIRSMHFVPQLISIYSSVIKYLIPTKIETVLDNLGSLLGARSYLREELSSGIYQKLVRDNSIIGLFDGSTIINLQTISNQINQISKKFLRGEGTSLSESMMQKIFAFHNPIQLFDLEQLTLSNHGHDPLTHTFKSILSKLETLLTDQNCLTEMSLILNLYIEVQKKIFTQINFKDFFHEKLDKEKEQLLHHYCLLVAASCCLNVWLYNKNKLPQVNNVWIYACLVQLLKEIDSDLSLKTFCIESIYQSMNAQFDNNQLFSLIHFNLP